MTQEDLARLVGVRRETIGNLEKGRYNPSLVLAWNIAKVFQVPIEEVFTVEEQTADCPKMKKEGGAAYQRLRPPLIFHEMVYAAGISRPRPR